MRQLLAVTLLTLPAWSLLIRPGIYSMHDFHPFRQYEFDLCAREGVWPCRWAPDAGMGYGEPVFNFYGQFPYWLGQLFRLGGLSLLDSVKGSFILSLVGSGWGMYLLARRFWGKAGAVLAAGLYVWAPYRAVDVWVRGALGEALAFVLFPLIFLQVEKWLVDRHRPALFALALLLATLTVSHNISALMVAPFLAVWCLWKMATLKHWWGMWGLLGATAAAYLLAAFYLLPVVAEGGLVTLSQTVAGYYDFRLHFTSLRQLFWSRAWGYGGSVWGPNDTMSFSVGHLHWVVLSITAGVVAVRRRSKPVLAIYFWLLAAMGLAAVFLTHGKSEFIWKSLPFLPYVQFPWRFLAIAAFFASLAVGALAVYGRSRWIIGLVLTAAIVVNGGYFRPDIWRETDDRGYFSPGRWWDEQRSAALADFWPVSAQLPVTFAPPLPTAVLGRAAVEQKFRGAHRADYRVTVESLYAKLVFPTVSFPGWRLFGAEGEIATFPWGKTRLVTTRLIRGDYELSLRFTNTWPRSLGNWVSGVALLGLVVWRLRYAQL